jgi:methionyl-tRNA synthetase
MECVLEREPFASASGFSFLCPRIIIRGMKKFYVTTPIYYINGLPHIGHIFTTLLADVAARYHRLLGDDVFFLTGTDEHGQKAEKAAQELGISPREMADRIARPFQELWDRLNFKYSDFIRTTESRHHQGVVEMFRRAKANGDIYLGDYEGWYCTFDESFWTEGQLVNGNCPDCGRKVDRIKEKSYFFRLSKYQEPLLKFFREKPDFIVPESRYNEVVSFVERGLRDLSVSRLKLTWGIPVPDDPNHVIYVWFDALMNYITGVGFPSDMKLFNKYWPADAQIIGKDILRFHAVYWPAFLLSAGVPLPRQLVVHSWWLSEGAKISKSRDNVVEPNHLIEKFGVDGLRYFLVREAPMEADSAYSFDSILKRVNSDLANDLGNLVSRALTMVQRYCDGIVPASTSARPPFVQALEKITTTLPETVASFGFSRILVDLWEVVNALNRYIVEQQPWSLAKNQEDRSRLHDVLYNTCEGLRWIAAIAFPVIPSTADQIWKQLGLRKNTSDARLDDLRWGGLAAGTHLGELGPIFPRVEVEEEEKVSESESHAEETGTLQITIEEFLKTGLKVAEVKSAEKVEGSRKLLKLNVDLGGEIRTVVAGIADVYPPEELIGKQVIVVTNLKPAKLMGVESNGMVLAASVEGKPVLVGLSKPVPNGTPVK